MANEFGDVLRQLGSVLNPHVAAGLEQELLQRNSQEQQMRMAVLPQLITQQKEAQVRDLMSQTGGDAEKAIAVALQNGKIDVAQHLTPLLKVQQEAKTRAEAQKAMSELYTQPADANAPPDQRAQRVQQLQRMSQAYAHNPAAVTAIQREIDKLNTPEAAPKMRTRIQGDQEVQEEFDPKTQAWKQVGSGPRFARQVAPVINVANQGVLDPVKDKAELRDLAIQSLYDPASLAGFRRDTKTMGSIQRERVALMKELGVTSEDVVSGRAGFKADSASLNKLTPQYDAITAFEKTAIRNGELLKTIADKTDTTGVPAVERWIRAGRKEIAGDTDVTKLQAQIQIFRTEAARILSNPNLSGQLTDNARHEVEGFLSNNASAAQIRGVVDLLKTDFDNRKVTLEDQISGIRARMRSRVAPNAGAPVPSALPTPAAPAAAPPAAGGWKITPVPAGG